MLVALFDAAAAIRLFSVSLRCPHGEVEGVSHFGEDAPSAVAAVTETRDEGTAP